MKKNEDLLAVMSVPGTVASFFTNDVAFNYI